MSSQSGAEDISDLFIIGGGVNGCGIARDAAGRGLSVTLAEMDDLASATSSASTKLFHGGLRYLEFFEFKLVRHALKEREVLLQAMPHISRSMRFVLPYHKDMRFEANTPTSRLLRWIMPWRRGRRPAWLMRLGLFFYDNLGGRKILPATRDVDLTTDPVGAPLNDRFKKAYEYSDCWVDDARLVALCARDANERGALIMTRCKVTAVKRGPGHWRVTTEEANTGEIRHHVARVLINAGGPWVQDILENVAHLQSSEQVRLVRGSHIIVNRLFEHDKSYFFQGEDGRIIFAIPYEEDFTLIGTTEGAHTDLAAKPLCSEAERDYLLDFASAYFRQPVTRDQIVWSYSGIRPLFSDGQASASAATREHVLHLDTNDDAPLVSVYGGKITVHRLVSEEVVDKVAPFFPHAGKAWTAGAPLPGGDFAVSAVADLIAQLSQDYPFLDGKWARRLVRAYGTDARLVLSDATSLDDLGTRFSATLYEREVRWLMAHEFARTAEDVVWRRSKLGLVMSEGEVLALGEWMKAALRSA